MRRDKPNVAKCLQLVNTKNSYSVFIFQLLYEFKIFQNKLAKGGIEGGNIAASDIFLYTVAKKKKKKKESERETFFFGFFLEL